MKICKRSFKTGDISDDHIKETLILKSMFISSAGFNFYHILYFKKISAYAIVQFQCNVIKAAILPKYSSNATNYRQS